MHVFLFFKVGLALVVNGEVTVGVMGCPNWTNDTIVDEKDDRATVSNSQGILMVSHVGCGTWSRHLSCEIGQFTKARDIWKRCFVDSCSVVHMARYCIPDSQTWDMIPLSVLFSSTSDESDPMDENKILLIPVFCGRSVALPVADSLLAHDVYYHPSSQLKM
jgi:3'(2'), 5'-bisphosphate nucleotidase